MTPRRYGDLAVVVLAAGAAYAVVHRLVGGSFWRFTPGFNVAFDVIVAVLCIAAAVAASLRRSFFGLFVAMNGAATLLMVGFVLSVVAYGTGLGVPFMAAGVLAGIALKRATPAWDAATDEAHEAHEPSHWPGRRHRQPA
jgi:hypothetical protein